VAYLIDTSVLARLANSADVSYPVAIRAVFELHRRGEMLHVAPQNLNAPDHCPRISVSRAQLIAAFDARCWMIARG
jgi:hypothetical protein